MDDYEMFKRFRLPKKFTDTVLIGELSSQLGYMNDIARNNVDTAIDEDNIELSYYWNGFADITEYMGCILEQSDADYKCPMNRRQRMRGMIDACNTILTMINEEDFDIKEE